MAIIATQHLIRSDLLRSLVPFKSPMNSFALPLPSLTDELVYFALHRGFPTPVCFLISSSACELLFLTLSQGGFCRFPLASRPHPRQVSLFLTPHQSDPSRSRATPQVHLADLTQLCFCNFPSPYARQRRAGPSETPNSMFSRVCSNVT